MMIKRLTLHQTSHVLNSPNRKCLAEFQLFCKSNHRLHYSVASIDVWSQWRSDNLDQWKNYLLFSSSFGEQDIYECRRSYGRICASFHYPWNIMCCLLWKTWGTGACFCGCVGFICGEFSFILFQIQFDLLINFFTAYFTPDDHIKSCYGPRMDKGNPYKTWRGVVGYGICWERNSRYRRIVHLRKIWIKEYPFRKKRWSGLRWILL